MTTTFFIETDDRAITFAPWEVKNTLPDDQDSMVIEQTFTKATPTPHQIHEVMVVINDVMKDAGLTAAFLLAVKRLFDDKGGKAKLKIRVTGTITRDIEDKINKIGCEFEIDKK